MTAMGKNLGLGALTLTGALLAVAPSSAQAGRPERLAAASAGIARADSDGDGRLSRDEHGAAARKMFESMDANHDGKVTADEINQAQAHMKGRRPSRSMKAANLKGADKIKLSDRDGDGVLTAEEHLATALDAFARMDSDKDGQLTSAELAAGHGKIQRKGRR